MKIAKPVRRRRPVLNARPPFPQKDSGGRGKWRVIGRGQGDRLVEVVYIIDPDDAIFIIHAMPLISRRRRGGR